MPGTLHGLEWTLVASVGPLIIAVLLNVWVIWNCWLGQPRTLSSRGALSVALLLVTEPSEFVMNTQYCPVQLVGTLFKVSTAFVAPARTVPL